MSKPQRMVRTKFSEDVDGPVDVRSSTLTSEESLAKSAAAAHQPRRLTWRSWTVVLVTCFAQMAQVFVIAGSGQVIAFIARDLGDAGLSGWIIRECGGGTCRNPADSQKQRPRC